MPFKAASNFLVLPARLKASRDLGIPAGSPANRVGAVLPARDLRLASFWISRIDLRTARTSTSTSLSFSMSETPSSSISPRALVHTRHAISSGTNLSSNSPRIRKRTRIAWFFTATQNAMISSTASSNSSYLFVASGSDSTRANSELFVPSWMESICFLRANARFTRSRKLAAACWAGGCLPVLPFLANVSSSAPLAFSSRRLAETNP
mmetsp:Transcript_27686/g.64412  ORF Transcript_27686/g.64412 Transcript_27686/m.64412 type:complete len:208 (+) Transcript_27686:176-799(+)